MNRNLKGELFSRDELIDMAVEIGAFERDKITRDIKTWEFHAATRKHRLDMFFRGEALLNTRGMEPSTKAAPPSLDEEVLRFFGVDLDSLPKRR